MQSQMFRGIRKIALFRGCAASVLAGALVMGPAAVRAGNVSFTDYSVVTIGASGNTAAGTLSTSSDITGNAFVSGSVSGNSFTVASDLSQVPKGTTQYGLSVLGNISSGNINMQNGYSVIYGGTNSTGINLNGNPGGTITSGAATALSATQQMLYSQVTSASSTWTTMTTTGSVIPTATSSGQPITSLVFDYTGKAGGVAVFDVTAAQLTSAYSNLQNLNLELNGASTVVINVTGATGSFSFPGNLGWQGNFTDQYASEIIWNFGTATTNLSTSNEFIGSIIAPDATLKNNSDIDGSIYVEAFQGNGEVHYSHNGYVVAFNGDPPGPSSVPEPSASVLGSLGAVGVALIGIRTKRKARRPVMPAIN